MIFHLLQYGSVQRLEAIAACRRARRAAIAAVRQVGTLTRQFPKSAARRKTVRGASAPPLPLAGAAWLWAGGGGISTSVWRIMSVSIEWRIESTARSPVVGRCAVAADENLRPWTKSTIWRWNSGL
jgi:hypothetical protein